MTLGGRTAGRAEQLALALDAAPRSAEELLAVLRTLGLVAIDCCRLTRNRTVMVSYREGELRVHEGYLPAPREVLRAIVGFVNGRTARERRAARSVILAFPVARPARARRRERTAPADERLVAKLALWHARYNERHFGGGLRPVAIRVSRRLRARLGHYTAATPPTGAAPGDPAEIVISRRHIRRHGWDEALHTLLHEMVHQWQDEAGHAIDHGRTFRQKAREVGITPTARRMVQPGERPTDERMGVKRQAARGG